MDFRYNASALGAGAVIERDGETTQIPSLASVALAPTGGVGYGIEKNYRSEALSFAEAKTSVAGSELDGLYTTTTEVSVTGLSVYDKLSVGRMEASMVSTRRIKDPYSQFTIKVHYDDIAVGGREIVPELDVEVSSCLTYKHFQRFLEVMKRKLYKGEELEGILARFGAKTLDELLDAVRRKQAIQGSIVRKLDHRASLQSENHMVPIPGVGKAYFGEVVLKPEHRLVSLLRIELNPNPRGRAVPARRAARASNGEARRAGGGGSMTIASVEGNGSPILP